MLKRLIVAALALHVIAAPVLAEQVKGTTAPAASAVTQEAQSSDSAVVKHGLTTATVTVPASDKPQTFEIPVKDFIDAMMPYVVSAVGGIITVLAGFVTAWLRRKWNIDIDQAHRSAWQQAAQNAAGALIARGAVSIESGKVSVKNEEMASVINTVMARIPDAMSYFGFTPQDVQHLIVAKIPQVMSGSVPPVVAPAPGV